MTKTRSTCEQSKPVPRSSAQEDPRRPNELDETIGDLIRRLRKERGLSQPALAAKCGLSFQQIQKYERGQNRISASRLYDIAAALQVSVTSIFERLANEAAQDTTRSERQASALREQLGQVASALPPTQLELLISIGKQFAAPPQTDDETPRLRA